MRLFALIFAVLLTTGCAVLSESGPTSQMLTVKYATLKALNGDADKARTWIKWVDEGLQFINANEEVKVSILDVAVRKRIKWESLPPEESLLIDAVLLEVRMRLIDELGTNILGQEQRVKLVKVLEWSKEAAYGLAEN